MYFDPPLKFIERCQDVTPTEIQSCTSSRTVYGFHSKKSQPKRQGKGGVQKKKHLWFIASLNERRE